jgi:hypothetical protein
LRERPFSRGGTINAHGRSSDNKERDGKGDLTLRLSVLAISTFVIITADLVDEVNALME